MFPSHLSHLSHRGDNNNFRKEEFILTQELTGPHSGKAWWQETALHLKPGSRERQMLELRSFSLSHSVEDPSSWDGADHIQGGSSRPSRNSLVYMPRGPSSRWFKSL